MDKMNILLAAAVVIIAACAIYVFMDGDMDDEENMGGTDGFTLHINSDGGTPDTTDTFVAFSELGDGKYYWFYDFTDITAPPGNAPYKLDVEDDGFGFFKIKIMAGTGKMIDIGDGWYQWDKNGMQFRKFDDSDKEVYYKADDSSEMDVVVFANQVLSVNILWTEEVLDVSFYSNNTDMLTKKKLYANVNEFQSGFLPGADLFTSDGKAIIGWSDDQHCSPDDVWKPGSAYYGYYGTTIWAIWGDA